MCDTLCVIGPGRTLFAKNSDRPTGEVQLVESFGPRPAGGTVRTQYLNLVDRGAAAFTAGRPMWLWGVEHGVNEHRVAVGNERLWTRDDASAMTPALLGMDLVRLGLEGATSAGHAVDLITNLIEEHGQGGIGEAATGEAYFSSFLVADPHESWIIETSARTWVAKPIEASTRGASISNRLTIETDWTRSSHDVPSGANFQMWADRDYPTAHADQRIAATGATAKAIPAPTPRDLAAVMRHHGHHPWGRPGTMTDAATVDSIPGPKVSRDGRGVSVCMHLRGWEATTGSMIAELPVDPAEPLRAWVALGHPCVGVFVPIFPPAAVPHSLAEQATWLRFEALAQAVESAADHDRDAGTERLLSIRAVLGDLESSLWDDADAITAAGRQAHIDFAAAVPARLLQALDRVERQQQRHWS